MTTGTFIGKTAAIIGGTAAAAVVLLSLARGGGEAGQGFDTAVATSPAASNPASESHGGLLYGRITTDDDGVYEGRLRFGGDEEALWSNQFNGFKPDNVWESYVPSDQLPKEQHSFTVFGKQLFRWSNRVGLGRPFMARMGDITRIEPRGNDLWVTLKSGTRFHLDRFGADDLADGLRVWDARRGVVDVGEWQIRSIEFLDPGAAVARPAPLYGTVRTRHGAFTGLIQWDREACLVTDQLEGLSADGELSLRFDGIRSIARQSENSSLVTLVDGSEVVLSGTRQVGEGNRGVYVDDARYGRVLVSWDAFESVEFSTGGTGPGYDAFAPGQPLMGTVVTRSGRRLAGRLVYDLDESETTETLDAPSQGVDYMLPFDRIASIVLPELEAGSAGQAGVTLRSGEELHFELAGDFGEFNGGMLIFVDGPHPPEYVSWTNVRQVDFDHR
ncbi:MAG TPA: hypothetical protein VMM79_01150 [Longimicrobiales bacterium]|nr:hypothetical protein [Longimicrobiales bacterium]